MVPEKVRVGDGSCDTAHALSGLQGELSSECIMPARTLPGIYNPKTGWQSPHEFAVEGRPGEGWAAPAGTCDSARQQESALAAAQSSFRLLLAL